MPLLLEKLHNDHVNFLTLLSFLDEQHRLLQSCDTADLESVLDAIWYMKEYPDFVHHPLENIIFKYYLQYYDEEVEHIDALLHEHEEMPQLTAKLLSMLRAALVDVPQNREELCSYLKQYIKVQREHMNQEEAHVYPILNEKLDENDWQRINSELSHIEDPLFGGKVEKSYQVLLQKIIG